MEIKELKLFTNFPKELKKFYSDDLGLIVSELSNTEFKIKVGKTDLYFSEEKKYNPYYHFAINIPQNKISEAIAWLKPKVSLIESESSPLIDFDNWNAHSVYFYDPAGNIVELIARHDLDNTSDEPFSIKSLLNISEIGMPVENVKTFHDLLNEKYGENLWSGNLETFAAIGNQEGLFIVVTTHRNWFPTDKSCNIYPLTIKVENKNSEPVILEHLPYKIIFE